MLPAGLSRRSFHDAAPRCAATPVYSAADARSKLVAAAVRNAVRIPLAEHDLLACWMLDSVGLPADSGARTVCLLDASGSATGVPWAATAVRVVVIWPDGAGFRVADVDPEALRITAGANLIGEPRDTVTADTAELPGTPVSADLVRQLMADQHLIMAPHTLEHWPTELYLTGPVMDRENREGWLRRGGKDAYGRACDEVDRRLAAYRPIETDPAVVAEMQRIIRSGFVEQAELPELPAAEPTAPPATDGPGHRRRNPRRERC